MTLVLVYPRGVPYKELFQSSPWGSRQLQNKNPQFKADNIPISLNRSSAQSFSLLEGLHSICSSVVFACTLLELRVHCSFTLIYHIEPIYDLQQLQRNLKMFYIFPQVSQMLNYESQNQLHQCATNRLSLTHYNAEKQCFTDLFWLKAS